MGNLVKWEGGIGEEQPKTGEPVIKTSKEIGGFTQQLRPQNKTIQGILKSYP